jgi:hypothetical protein
MELSRAKLIKMLMSFRFANVTNGTRSEAFGCRETFRAGSYTGSDMSALLTTGAQFTPARFIKELMRMWEFNTTDSTDFGITHSRFSPCNSVIFEAWTSTQSLPFIRVIKPD